MKNLPSISLMLLFVAGLLWGCEKKENEPVPTLPPTASMSIDFSNFAAKKSADAGIDVKSTLADKSNFIVAATLAGVWNTILAVNLAIPVESFKLAVNTTPVNLEKNKWEWTYNFNAIGVTYKARLTGEIRTGDVKWKMYISKEGVGAFPELLWFEGTSMPDGSRGQWILNHSQQFPEPVLQVDWEGAGAAISKIRYTYIRDKKDDRSTDFFKGSFIEYGLIANTLNAFYTIHQNTGVQNVFNDIYIEWSTSAHNGRIKANYHFKDDLWHCWNETGDNIICK